VEGAIAARSQDAYEAIEGDLGRVSAALKAQPADRSAAATGVARLRTTLTPFTQEQTYGILDAAAIILREGLEALLVVGALLAFLKRSGNQAKVRWIWLGAAVGILVSIGAAFVLQYLFSKVTAGQNREVIEGVTGLVAAGLLLYVSYWLHSKASLHEWQKYINTQTTQALARGNMIGLALLSFLAIFREGAETAIFYLGMAPSIQMRDLFLGLALGSVALVVIAALMFIAGVRLPLRLFFRVAGLLVYYLGFKFLGAGVHALQVAGVFSISPVAFLKEIPFLGIYPTWETLLPQMALLVVAILVFLYWRTLDRRVQAKGLTPVA
jgi:high-affinity iron transporter